MGIHGEQKMTFGEKLKTLRKEKAWSQDDLAEKINADGRQISRYETDKMLPTAEVLVKIAKVLNVSLDYLLMEEISRRPLFLDYEIVVDRLQEMSNLTNDDINTMLHILEAISAKNRIVTLAKGVKEKQGKFLWNESKFKMKTKEE